jgi:hypothetical protein
MRFRLIEIVDGMLRGVIFGLALITCGASASAQELAGARQVYDGKMLARIEVATFEHSDTLFPSNIVQRSGPARPLAAAAIPLKNIQFRSGG